MKALLSPKLMIKESIIRIGLSRIHVTGAPSSRNLKKSTFEDSIAKKNVTTT